MTRLLALLALLLTAAACNSNGVQAGQGPWAPTTVPFDSTCAACREIGKGELADTGGARILVDTQTDDPTAQWNRCLFGFLRCIDGGGEIPACVEQSTCPDACKQEFSRQPATDFTAQTAAVDHVFFDDGALCASP